METHTLYQQVISLEHLFQAWDEFKNGKRKKLDVKIFERNLEDNIFLLHDELKANTYNHSPYIAFNIYDPKFRHIHKAEVRDRIVHHAIVSVVEPIFDKNFIYDSYSCRTGKGTHRAVKRLASFVRKLSRNYKDNCFVLKLDIKKFFASVDHEILLEIIGKSIKDRDLMVLIKEVIGSFSRGIPIGNLTSQLFANIYLNELDRFVKHNLRVKYYIRYCDDFAILSHDREYLEKLIVILAKFLNVKLRLQLHKEKIIIRKYKQGIDFLGYVILPHIILPRTRTTRRILKRINEKMGEYQKGRVSEFSLSQTLQSYLGYLSHANSYKLSQRLKNQIWLASYW